MFDTLTIICYSVTCIGCCIQNMILLGGAMPRARPPRSSGIYQIRCIPTGKIYIGSAANLRARWDQHRRLLRRGKHANVYLQKAWDKHGEANFEFSVLELVDRADLLCAEQ